MSNIGKIRVGRRIYDSKGKFTDPKLENYKTILPLTKSTKDFELSPYCLTDKNGVIIENKWQFSKVYKTVPKSKQFYSRFDKTVIWEHGEEVHYKKGKVTKAYLKWRKKGFKCKYPIRYPVGHAKRTECLGYLKKPKDTKLLDYITARKKGYVPMYIKAAKKVEKFKKLKTLLEKGKNLLIIDVDGPHEESLKYYKGKYNINPKFIKNNTVKVNKKNMKILLNDPKHPFGHGYCLGMALLGIKYKKL